MPDQRGRGRPPFAPTDEQRQRVRQMMAGGMKADQAARVIGIDPATLRKHFAEEVEHGAAVAREEVIALLFTSARDGNVSAQKALAEMTARSLVVQSFEQPKPERKGKKEAAADAARVAGHGSEWGDDLAVPPQPH